MRVLAQVVLLPLVTAAAVGQTAPSSSSSYQPITGGGRIEWAVMNTVNWPSFGVGLINAGWGTYFNHPREYGTTVEGFGSRFGLRLTGVATSNTMESSLGAIWGEDPRYSPATNSEPFMQRAGHIVKMTFMARNRDGRIVPAYARYAAIGGSNFLSNAWRPDSDATVQHAVIRIGLGFLGRVGVNTYYEFWPDVKSKLFKP